MAVCPPGFICLNNGIAAVIALFIFVTFYYLMYLVNSQKKEVTQRTIVNTGQPEQHEEPEQPEREYRGYSRGMDINVKTRAQDSYQQVGVLYKTSSVNTSSSINTPGNNTDTSVLPLFGRRVYKGSNMWNYYTSTSDHSIVKLALHINGENCTKERGCSELTNGSSVNVDALNGTYKVEIYEYDAPRYIPYI
jgi:hypothetical protein